MIEASMINVPKTIVTVALVYGLLADVKKNWDEDRGLAWMLFDVVCWPITIYILWAEI